MDSFLVSTGAVAVAEIGDKTQLLALVLAARYRAPVPIILGILLATLANHAFAAAAGGLAAQWAGPAAMRWILGGLFLAMAAWCLIPDRAGDVPWQGTAAGAFAATLVAFFLVEIGDKTQIATVGLAARFDAVLPVMLGTTLGMLIANVPVVLCGEGIAKRIPLKAVRAAAAAIFAVLGALVMIGIGLPG